MPEKPDTMSRSAYVIDRMVCWPLPRHDHGVARHAPWLQTIIRPNDIPAITKAAGGRKSGSKAPDATIAAELSEAFSRAADYTLLMPELAMPPSKLRSFGHDVSNAVDRLLHLLGYGDAGNEFAPTVELDRLFCVRSSVAAADLDFLNDAIPENLRAALLEMSPPSVIKVAPERRIATQLVDVAPIALALLKLQAEALIRSMEDHPELSRGKPDDPFPSVLYAYLAQAWLDHFGPAETISRSLGNLKSSVSLSNLWLDAMFEAAARNAPQDDSMTDFGKQIIDLIRKEEERSPLNIAKRLHRGLGEVQTGVRFEEKRNRK